MLCFATDALHSGAAGQVFEGRFNDSEVALKEIYQHLMNGDIEAVSKEARILASLRHPNIVTFYGMWEHLDVELSTWCIALWVGPHRFVAKPLLPRRHSCLKIAVLTPSVAM